MSRPYYNARNLKQPHTTEELFLRLRSMYAFFQQKDYFKQKTGLSSNYAPDSLKHEVELYLGFDALRMDRWFVDQITPENIFSVIEFLYDRCSKPGSLVTMSERGYEYEDYISYDEAAGKAEFVSTVNSFLANFGSGYLLNNEGNVVLIGSEGLQYILSADIPAFDDPNVDSKVRLAIEKWRSRKSTDADRKESIRLLADVFEYLKKAHNLEGILGNKDTSDLFNIANNFSIRHHNPSQKNEYDLKIWYSWIFHFYLATYHAAIRLILAAKKAPSKS